MWTAKNRRRYDRSALRYPSDLTDDEWAHVEPFIPPAKRGGNKRHVDVREVMNGIMYVLSTGCQWRAIPKDLPPRSTLFDYLDLWSYDGTLDRIHHALYVECREQGEREASPTAAIIDSQSVKSAEKRGACIDPPGYDAGKKIKGKKRHILVDTLGLLLHAIVHPANIQSAFKFDPRSACNFGSDANPMMKHCVKPRRSVGLAAGRFWLVHTSGASLA